MNATQTTLEQVVGLVEVYGSDELIALVREAADEHFPQYGTVEDVQKLIQGDLGPLTIYGVPVEADDSLSGWAVVAE